LLTAAPKKPLDNGPDPSRMHIQKCARSLGFGRFAFGVPARNRWNDQMAGRGRPPGLRFYVYVVLDGVTPLYVGKGVGRRMRLSAKRCGGEAKVLEWFDCETMAFEAERRWIAELQPQMNKSRGGNGGRAGPVPLVPPRWRGRLTEREMRAAIAEQAAFNKARDEIGPRRYVARFLLSKDLTGFVPPSEVDGIRKRLEAVANGPWV
jgi:hypothetical protein